MISFRRQIPTLLEWSLLIFLSLSILWRGGKGLEATWILAGLAVLLTFSRFWLEPPHPKRVHLGISPLLWIMLMLFLGWSVLSFVFSTAQNYGLDEVLRDVSLILIALWVSRRLAAHDSGVRFERHLIAVIAWSILLACVVGVAVYVLQPVNRFVGTFFDYRFDTDYWPNAWAEAVLLFWPIVVIWSRTFPLWLRSMVVGCVLGALLLSFSRGALIAFCLQGTIWTSIIAVRHLRQSGFTVDLRARVLPVVLVMLGSTVVALGIFSLTNVVRSQYHEVESVSAKATFTAEEGSSSISERRDFWQQSLQLSLHRPWIGIGPYSFRFAQPGLQTQVFATSDHPHNVFLKLAMERGWPVAVLFAFTLLLILLPASRRIITTKDAQDITIALPILIAILGVVAHNLIDYNLQFVGIVLPFWIFLGVLMPTAEWNPTAKKWSRIVEILLTILLGCVAVFEGRYLVISSLGRHAEAAGNPAEALNWYDQARGQIFSRDMHLSRANLFLQQREFAKADAALDDYAVQNSRDARLWILRGDVAAAAGDTTGAYSAFSRAFQLAKYDYLESFEGIVRFLTSGQHMNELTERREEFLQVFHAFGDAILRNAHFIALSQNVEVFERISKILQSAYPADRTAIRELTAKVLAHAQDERQKVSSRTPGILW